LPEPFAVLDRKGVRIRIIGDKVAPHLMVTEMLGAVKLDLLHEKWAKKYVQKGIVCILAGKEIIVGAFVHPLRDDLLMDEACDEDDGDE
jgi:hypothetical protein